MAEPQDFADLIRRVRAGDDAAADELFRRYGAVFNRTIRLRRENDPAMRRLVDTEDISQSVFGSLFVGLRFGKWLDDDGHDNIANAGALINLLHKIGHNKFTAKQRREHRRKGTPDSDAVAPGPSPSQVASWKELWQQAQSRLNDGAPQILELILQGKSWKEIADTLGGTAEARRKQWDRKCARVAEELELDRAE